MFFRLERSNSYKRRPVLKSGDLPLAQVQLVLESYAVSVCRRNENGKVVTVMSKNSVVIALVLSERVGRRVLQLLQRKFGVPIHHFYNPLELPGADQGHVN